MRIEIVTDRANFRRWRVRLRDRLSRLLPDATVSLVCEEGADVYPLAVDLLLALERILLRRSSPTLCDSAPIDGRSAPSDPEAAPDVVIDLTGREAPRARGENTLVLRPLYDGASAETAAVAALLANDNPRLALEDVGSGVIVAEGLASLEAADGLTGGLEAVFSRITTLIERALLSPRRVLARPAAAPSRAARGVAAFFLRNVAFHCARRIYHLCCHSPHWRIGWRFNQGPGVLETGGLAGPKWSVLPDLGDSFAADPFPIEWRGRTYIFFERLDYRNDKGVIFAQPFDEFGPAGEPVLALEEPWHLSYPFLIAHGGELYMLPEASASGAVSIYRCVDFPGQWRCEGQLLTGIEAADATIFQHAGRFWMTSVVRDAQGGYSDTLAIHHAPDLFGPWEEHALRPVLVDCRLARPAGAVTMREGALWRPTQDCSTGYGKQLALARIDRLDPQDFAQTRMNLISPGPLWPGIRLHTLNRWGRLECIDGAIFTPKNKTLRQWTRSVIDRGALD